MRGCSRNQARQLLEQSEETLAGTDLLTEEERGGGGGSARQSYLLEYSQFLSRVVILKSLLLNPFLTRQLIGRSQSFFVTRKDWERKTFSAWIFSIEKFMLSEKKQASKFQNNSNMQVWMCNICFNLSVSSANYPGCSPFWSKRLTRFIHQL